MNAKGDLYTIHKTKKKLFVGWVPNIWQKTENFGITCINVGCFFSVALHLIYFFDAYDRGGFSGHF